MLNLREGYIFAHNYRLVRLIDTGGFADVWEALFLTAGNTVALKIYPRLDADGVKNIELEYSNQSELSHSNLLIARYFGFHEGYPFLEMRYCSKGNAASRVNKVEEKELATCMYQIGCALEYLHDDDRVHQDIKPTNFLIDAKDKYHLSDLGLSLKLRTTIQRFTTAKVSTRLIIAGTTPPCYRAPELCDKASIGAQPIKATDIWAFGASLYELATGELPFGEFGGCTQLSNPEIPDLPDQFSKELSLAVKSCLAKNTWDRPKAGELVKQAHHYLETGKWMQTNNPPPPNSKSNHTAKDGNFNQGTQPAINDKHAGKPKWRVLSIVSLLLIMVIASMAFYYFRSGSRQAIPKPSPTGGTNTTIHPTDTIKTDTGKITPAPVTPPAITQNKPTTKKQVTPADNNEVSFTVTRLPAGECPPTITKIIRTKNKLMVVFFLRGCLRNCSLYAPGSDQSFYIRTSRDKTKIAELRSISMYGDITVPKNGLTVTATFDPVNENINEIDIMEGTPFDSMGTTYFNFKGIRLR